VVTRTWGLKSSKKEVKKRRTPSRSAPTKGPERRSSPILKGGDTRGPKEGKDPRLRGDEKSGEEKRGPTVGGKQTAGPSAGTWSSPSRSHWPLNRKQPRRYGKQKKKVSRGLGWSARLLHGKKDLRKKKKGSRNRCFCINPLTVWGGRPTSCFLGLCRGLGFC